MEKLKSNFQSSRDELKEAKEELVCAKDELAIIKEDGVAEYKESADFVADLSFGNVEAMEIGFSCLYDKVARDFPFIDLSLYTLSDIVLALVFKDGISNSACQDTPSPLDPRSSDFILFAILEDYLLRLRKRRWS